MTNNPPTYRPDNLNARIIVASGGALIILVLAVIGFAISDSWIPGTVALLLIPLHIVSAITDTTVLDDPRNAGTRAVTELRRLAGGGVLGSGFTNSARTPGPPAQRGNSSSMPTPWGPPPGPGGPGAGERPAAPGWESDAGWASAPGWDSAAGPGPGPASAPAAASPTASGVTNGPASISPTGPHRPADGTTARPPRIPLGPDRGFEPPSATGPSTLYGFGSYGARDTADPEPPVERLERPTDNPVDVDPEDDPDMTIQRPPRDH